MKTRTSVERKRLFRNLAAQLAALEWISEGYAQNRGPGAGGPCFQWTRKVKGKTVSVALSREQFEALQKAIQNWQQAQKLLQEMRKLSRDLSRPARTNPTQTARQESFRTYLSAIPTFRVADAGRMYQ